MKTVVILQSNYIPWKGYFDLMREANEFILFDDMQYTRRDWRNRNQIKTSKGLQWLTIPVEVKGKYQQRIDETLISENDWAIKHWQTLRGHYARAPCFRDYAKDIEALYEAAAKEKQLSRINRLFLEGIGRLLGVLTPISWSTDYPHFEGKTERLVGLCNAAGAGRYISGPAARDYIQPDLFASASIDLSFKDYAGYPEYPQLHPPFTHGVTVLDLLFNVGEKAPWYIWGWREGGAAP